MSSILRYAERVDGRSTSGFGVGVLMLDTRYPRLLGDVGNPLTWPFPVVYKVVRRARHEDVARSSPDADMLGLFVDAPSHLERTGVQAITTRCGFRAAYQPELAAAVNVPVFSSALLQVTNRLPSLRDQSGCVVH